MSKLWHRFRLRLARWVPYPVQGVGFSSPQDDPMDSGELPMLLDVEGRTGTVYLSHSMWAALGFKAGWLTKEEELAIWEREYGDGC